ncbi:hypothetical protein K2X05_09455 [bacterium]|nr:hypothetical protein [bacterium]
MRALIIFTLLLLNQISMAQDQKAATPTTTPAPTTTEAAPVDPPASVEATEEAPKVEPLKTGVLLNTNFTMASRKVDLSDAPIGKFRTTQLDTKVGYVFNFGLFAGAQLNYALGSTAGSGLDVDSTAYSVGPTIGYSCSTTGLFLTATYHLLGVTDFSGVGKYEKTNGYQIDLGYPMKINESLKLGPQLTLKRIDLKDGTGGLADTKIKELTPYFGLWLYF